MHSRNTKLYEQKYQTALIGTFNVFVRSKLEYCSIILNPEYLHCIDVLEEIQRKMLKTLYYRKHLRYIV